MVEDTNTYITKDGDTLEKIAEKLYNDPSKVNIIKKYNPTLHPMLFVAGIRVKAPILPHNMTGIVLDEGYNVFINSKKLNGSFQFKIEKKLFNLVDIVELRLSLNNDLKKEINPLNSPSIQIFYGQEKIFTGFVVSSVSSYGGGETALIVYCYSETHRLSEGLSSNEYLVYQNQNVKNILEKLTSYAGLKLDYQIEGQDPAFKSLQFDIGTSCLDIALYICKARGFYLRSSADGELIVFNKESRKLIEVFNIDSYPVESYREEINTEGLVDTVNVVSDNTLDNNGSFYSSSFDNLPFGYNIRNKSVHYTADYGLNFDKYLNYSLRQIVRGTHSLYLNVQVPYNRTAELYKIGDYVKLEGFKLMVNENNFIISSINIIKKTNQDSIILGLLIKNALNNPKDVEW